MKQLQFFNVLNTRLDRLITTVYNKSTFTGILKNYNYFLWSTYTKDLIKALIDRSFCLNNKWDGFHLNLESIRVILQRRLSFKLIDKSVKKYLIKKVMNMISETEPSKNKKLSNIWNWSFKITQNKLQKLTQQIFKEGTKVLNWHLPCQLKIRPICSNVPCNL